MTKRLKIKLLNHSAKRHMRQRTKIVQIMVAIYRRKLRNLKITTLEAIRTCEEIRALVIRVLTDRTINFVQ